ncbi:MAG: bifunctional folylpolyglutamate synthase/dihydrofolate synthase [Spirochaetales bacterium]|nr:bifunctional folylpolyglutamate synthase/dihydrofolate synthase [Spirochaetales bacterium]
MFSNSAEGFLWMEAFTNFEKAPDLTKRGYRLDRMKLLLECFSNPHHSAKVIHIAGSKGKGSTAAFTASILREAGYKTGMYSSPHISDYRERITVDGEFAPEPVYVENMNRIRELIEGDEYLSLPGGSEPTTFELLTLLAFLVFRETGCQWTVLETGLGGRLDATNLVDPEAVFLTPIELEHTDLLGDTLEKIAGEKAGIIKRHRPVFSSRQPREVLQVFRQKSQEEDAPFQYLPDLIEEARSETNYPRSKMYIKWKSGRFNLSELLMAGDHQIQNCALAISGIHTILPELTDNLINRAISEAFLPGRMEVVGNNPRFMLDGAHTKRSVSMALDTFGKIFRERGILIFGSVEGKDAKAMAEVLAGAFEAVIVSRPGTFKKSRPQELYNLFENFNGNCYLIEDPAEAEKKARELSGGKIPVLVTGSFYMIAEIRKILKKKDKNND